MRPTRRADIHPLLEKLPRGNGANEQSPNMRFADPNVIKSTPGYQFTDKKIWLGVIDGTVHSERIDPDDELSRLSRYVTGGLPIGISTDYHHTTVAGTRAGKGRAAIIPTLLTYSGSALVIDIKGELATITANRRAEMGQNVHVIDPFNVAKVDDKYKKAFNPLTILEDPQNDTIVEDAELISESLIPDSGGDQHWDEASRAFCSGVILHVITDPKHEEQRDLIKVRKLIAMVNDEMSGLEVAMKGNDAENQAVEFAAYEFWDKSDAEMQSVLSTLRRHLRFLGYGAMQKVLQGPSIDLAELKSKKKPTTIYMCLPALRMNSCSRWFRLFVNLALATLERTDPPIDDRPDVPVLFVLDEANVLGAMRSLQIAAGQLAGFGVKLWTIWQSIGQIKANYKDHYESFLAGILQFFGNSDVETLEWISKRLGSTTVKNPTKADVSLEDATQKGILGISLQNSVHALMGPEEISVHFGRDDEMVRQLVINPSFNPLILQRAYYDKHKFFTGFL